MFKKLTLGGIEVEMTANAATAIRYKQVFHQDLFQIMGNEERAEKEGADAVQQLAFIMCKQAEKVDMGKLDFEAYVTWAEKFPATAFIEGAEEILSIYMDSAQTTATP